MKLPPFGNIVDAYQQENVHFQTPLWIYTGKSGLEYAQQELALGIPCLYFPPNDNPQNYTWPVKNRNIVICDTGSMSLLNLHRIAYFCMRDGASTIMIDSPLNTKMQLYSKPKE